jgi:excisionase family DNA binding protein
LRDGLRPYSEHPDRLRIIVPEAVDPCAGQSSSDPKVDLHRPARSPWAYDADGELSMATSNVPVGSLVNRHVPQDRSPAMSSVATRFLSRDEAALRLGISPDAVPRLIASGELRTVRVVGLRQSIFESSVEGLIRRRVPPGRGIRR